MSTNARRSDVHELTFQALEARTDSIARDVYETALCYKEDAVGLYGAIMYAAIKILVKAERLAQPKTAREKRERERQIAFIKKVLASDMIRRGVHNEKTA